MTERYTLEEFVFIALKEKGEEGTQELLDILDTESRDIVQRLWGIFPYREHSIREVAKVVGLPRSTSYYKYRRALKAMKEEIRKRSTSN